MSVFVEYNNVDVELDLWSTRHIQITNHMANKLNESVYQYDCVTTCGRRRQRVNYRPIYSVADGFQAATSNFCLAVFIRTFSFDTLNTAVVLAIDFSLLTALKRQHA